MERTYLLIVSLLCLALVACSSAPATTPPPSPVTGDAGSGATPATGNTVNIDMTAKNFEFTPNAITVHKGDHVIIHITDSDNNHGLAVEGYNAHVEFGPGNTGATLDFIADKEGTFTFHCDVPCGPGHREMEGTLTVAA